MAGTILKQCRLCEEWFKPEEVKEITLVRAPTSRYDYVWICEECLSTTMVDRLAKRAKQILDKVAINEVELTLGSLKVRMVRFSPTPVCTPPYWPFPPSYYSP